MNNDRLKFRAWVDTPSRGHFMVYSGDNLPGFFGEWDGYEIMQWTGLRDLEGEEIYESDFVQLWYAPRSIAKGWIKFENGGFYFKSPEAYPRASLAHDCVFEHGNFFRVIGNKYETPDILENSSG